MPVIPYKEFQPEVSKALFIAPDCWITGKVFLAENVSILFGAALRGDIQNIKIGRDSNVQDNAVIHTSRGLHDCVIGEGVTVGHSAILHGCTVKDHCIIGMGATLLDDAEIGEYSIVGANSLVTMRVKIPAYSMVMGSPAKVVRQITEKEKAEIEASAKAYIEVGKTYSAYFAK